MNWRYEELAFGQVGPLNQFTADNILDLVAAIKSLYTHPIDMIARTSKDPENVLLYIRLSPTQTSHFNQDCVTDGRIIGVVTVIKSQHIYYALRRRYKADILVLTEEVFKWSQQPYYELFATRP